MVDTTETKKTAVSIQADSAENAVKMPVQEDAAYKTAVTNAPAEPPYKDEAKTKRAQLQERFSERFHSMYASEKAHTVFLPDGGIELTVSKSFPNSNLAMVGGLPGANDFPRSEPSLSWEVPIEVLQPLLTAAKCETIEQLTAFLRKKEPFAAANARLAPKGIVITNIAPGTQLDALFSGPEAADWIKAREESTITIPNAALVAATSLKSEALHVSKQH